MRTIPLHEAAAHLDAYGKLCKEELVIVTVDGEPAFQIAPLEDDDAFSDRLIASNAEFRQLLEERRACPTISHEELLRRLEED